ncbi:L-histidine N(alpha)-methyltransferase [Baekduia sp. Peel2402]|uniref:L-histidine N(alpha)-methyltransferase n=1 Tax=Baekduia sp. Peel2402 TaxID=3458296 RepID=UPI00403ECEE1
MSTKALALTDRIVVESFLDGGDHRTLADDVLDGLTRPFKELPPKHFYDSVGAELFDQICELPEYYPTRCEREILATRSGEIAALTGAGELVELGSGTAAKTSLLLAAMHEAGTLERYVPIDVTESMVRASAQRLVAEFDGLHVHGIVGDFERHLDRVPPPRDGVPRIVAFLGGTIGNFTPGSRRRFLRGLSTLLGPDDFLLVGTDLVKDPAIIEAAYDDSAGVTAAFNRNVLKVVNRELDADFVPESFDHVAFFDRDREWIEMRLRAQRPQRVTVGKLGLRLTFAAGEELRTEISAKFTRERVEGDLAAAGMELVEQLTDQNGLFALNVARIRT